MAGKRKENEAGSSNDLRADALRVLGVLKVATVDQIQRLSSPHLTYRHTTKPTPAKRKEARTASQRAAANDLRRHGLSVDGGRTRGGEELLKRQMYGRATSTSCDAASSCHLDQPADHQISDRAQDLCQNRVLVTPAGLRWEHQSALLTDLLDDLADTGPNTEPHEQLALADRILREAAHLLTAHYRAWNGAGKWLHICLRAADAVRSYSTDI